MHNVELSPVDSFSSPSVFQEPALGSEHFVATPSSASSLDRTAPAVDAQHAALQALISPVLDTELTIPSFRNCGNPQPYFPHPPANYSSPSDRHHVHLSDSPSSRLPRLLDQHDFNTLIPTQYVPVTPLTSLSAPPPVPILVMDHPRISQFNQYHPHQASIYQLTSQRT
jgi:hypothetical protein